MSGPENSSVVVMGFNALWALVQEHLNIEWEILDDFNTRKFGSNAKTLS